MNTEIAKEIANQIGHKAFCMLGAKNYGAGENYLSFRIGKNAKKVNYVKITLNGLDLYDVEYGRVYNLKYTVKSTENNLYFDMLHGSIEKNTSMYTSL